MFNAFRMANDLENAEIGLIRAENLVNILDEGLFVSGNLDNFCLQYEAVCHAIRLSIIEQMKIVRKIEKELYEINKQFEAMKQD